MCKCGTGALARQLSIRSVTFSYWSQSFVGRHFTIKLSNLLSGDESSESEPHRNHHHDGNAVILSSG